MPALFVPSSWTTRLTIEVTSFKIREEDLEAIKDAALAAAERFLHSHIARIRTTQKRLVIDLLEEHPQLAISVDNVTEYVNDLSPSMSDAARTPSFVSPSTPSSGIKSSR